MNTHTSRATQRLRYSLNEVERGYADPTNIIPDSTALKRRSGWRQAVLDLVHDTRTFMARWSEDDALYAHRYTSAWDYWHACVRAHHPGHRFGDVVVSGDLRLATPLALARPKGEPTCAPHLRLVRGG